jgi:D-3-phosphoglycerate dehydrogenase
MVEARRTEEREQMKSLRGEKILIGLSSFAALDKTPLELLVNSSCEVIENPFKRKLTKVELLDLLSTGITGIIAGLESLNREVLEKSSLKVISRCGSGLSNVDLESANELGIKVCFTPDGPTSAVAELTLGALLSLMRMIPQMNKDLHEGRWVKKTGMQLEGKTVLIIGFGRIGKCVASLLKPFKTNILIVDPNIHSPDENISVWSLEKALPKADIITLHSSGNECILGESEFSCVKPGAYFLNTARGELIDEGALINALDTGRVAGAWIDTFSQEPYSGPLCKYPQVILTPDVGSYTRECRQRMETEAVDNLIKAFKELEKNK